MENPEINPYTYGQLTCDKRYKNIQQWRKDSSSTSSAGKAG